MRVTEDVLGEFIEAACVPREAWHAGGTLERAEEIRAAHPDLAARVVHAAAVLGDADAVRRHLAADPALATARGGPRGWDALTHLCFSRYLRLNPARSGGFVRAAEALLDAGADANAGWFDSDGSGRPVWESVLYGAAGIAHHPGLTRLLLARGADPNDEETPYHAPEGYDNAAFDALVESGRLNADSLGIMLARKADWHDLDGVRLLLAHGADPGRINRWESTALHHAVRRDNHASIIEAMLDHGGDPTLVAGGVSAAALAARRGRGDLLDLFARRGIAIDLQGTDRLLTACARGDAEGVRAITEREPETVRAVVADGGAPLAEFAGNGNAEGVRHLLDLGVDVAARYVEGDGYYGIARNSTALHVAAWRLREAVVRLLVERGAPVDARDGQGRTPLQLAVRGCVDSYWKERRTPEPIRVLLAAGASAEGIPFPTGYDEADALLRQHGR